MGKAFEKQTKTTEDQAEIQVHALKSLESSNKELPPIKGLISKERLNLEIVDEIEKTEEEERKADRSKINHGGSNKTIILENLKQCTFLVMKLEIILLIRVWQMMKKTSC